MSYKNLLAAFAIFIAFAIPLSNASTVTLTGGCPLYVINSSRSYITFNIDNTGNGTASDLWMSANFSGIDPQNAVAHIQEMGPNSSNTVQFYLSRFAGQGGYAVNINATYSQSGSTYTTVFPCIIYIGEQTSGLLNEVVSVKGKVMTVGITNIAPEAIEAQVDAVVSPAFSVKNGTRAVTVRADGHTELYFNITTPSYNDATYPVIGELSYEYNGTHYAQMGSAPLVFGSGGIQTANTGGGGGIGLTVWILAAVVAVIVILIAASLLMRRRQSMKMDGPQQHMVEQKKDLGDHQVQQGKNPDEPK
jgi:hypothetical protein